MSQGRREQLIGAWGLVSYTDEVANGGEERARPGERLRGLIMYTPDGYMSVQLA